MEDIMLYPLNTLVIKNTDILIFNFAHSSYPQHKVHNANFNI